MKTILLAFMQKPTSDGLMFRTSETQQAAVVEPPSLPARNKLFRYFAGLMLVGTAVLGHLSPAHATQHLVAVPLHVDCSTISCTSLDQQTILGYSMFNEDNFASIFDGFSRKRKFYVHIPDDYDTVDGFTEKIPLIFAFHGGGQQQEAMVNGKWGDYFDQNIAFVIPLGEPDPCANNPQETQWMQPAFGANTTATDPNCDPATQVADSFGDTVTYWNASLPGTFTDVLFVEQLRALILTHFPKLNANKVYATGFSSGGGMTLSLLCYRPNLFRGFSVVAKMLAGANQRGDYIWDGVNQTDPNSLVATCGKSQWDASRATGLATPRLWGYGVINPPFNIPFRVTKPVALFAGDQDVRPVKIAPGVGPASFGEETAAQTMQNINDTGAFIRTRNNLNGMFFVQDPFLDTMADDATTQRRTFSTASNGAEPYSVFRRFLVQGSAHHSATHAMPDAQECPPLNWYIDDTFMSCDYDYTAQTKIFFEEHADLNLNP
jgi:poly(3-hydroxybutyrate) depolymerase